ncbi:MAG: peptide chain release factor 1 [Deinococcales bacterium]|nr:peptide chain release factor 1 [Deinococcales bacterium]
MTDRMKSLTYELELLERSLADPELLADAGRYRETMQRYSEVKSIVDVDERRREVERQLAELQELLDDPDLAAEAEREAERLEAQLEQLEQELDLLLLPRDPYDDKSVIVEIRAAAGGDEASLFAREMLDMYLRYAADLGFRTELLDSHATEVGGLTKVSFAITGRGAYRAFKFESGVHRVQRVPATESQGRIHTSTVTVAVLPEADDVDVALSPADYRVDVYRSSGPGGQSVNTTDSAVRITYHPGQEDEIIVTCQDGKSQIKNKERALAVLRSRLLERERAKAASAAREARLVQIGSGERSERIRTYNFPQSRITDHRIGFTTRELSAVLAGDLHELTAALQAEELTRLALEAARAAPAAAPARGAA